MMEPILKSGKAVLKKKETDKFKIEEVDKKALETSVFIEQISMFDGIWNKFIDKRNWTWFQEGKENGRAK